MSMDFTENLNHLQENYLKLIDILATKDYAGPDPSPLILPGSKFNPNTSTNIEEIVNFHLLECFRNLDQLVYKLDVEKGELYHSEDDKSFNIEQLDAQYIPSEDIIKKEIEVLTEKTEIQKNIIDKIRNLAKDLDSVKLTQAEINLSLQVDNNF